MLGIDEEHGTVELLTATGAIRLSVLPALRERLEEFEHRAVAIEVRDGAIRRVDSAAESSPWHFDSVAELAAQQGTEPATSVAALKADFWPEDEEVDDFVAAAKGRDT